MVILLILSGFLSGSETAFFCISRRQHTLFAESAKTIHHLAARLLDSRKQLLSSLLFANMIVNVLYFALTSVLSINLSKTAGAASAGLTAIAAFFALLLAGEMIPKSLAFSNAKNFAPIATLPCFILFRIISPILKILDTVIVSGAIRLLTPPADTAKALETVTANQFKMLLDSSRHRGLITEDENILLTEIVELSLLKVRHVTQPRVDMIAVNIKDSTTDILEVMTKNKMTKIPVYADQIDNILGIIHQRDLLLNPSLPAEKNIKPITFMPEQKTVESLLEYFRKSHTDLTIVVDEYGGIAGAVSIEDIVEELIGPLDTKTDIEPIEQIAPLTYRLAGNLAIHDWAEIFDIDPGQTRLTTIAGLTTAMLGKIPSPGDVTYLKNVKLTVENMQKNRIQTIILTLENIDK